MKYPFVSIMPLVDEVAGELKSLVKTSSFNEEDFYAWGVNAARLIAHVSYEEARDYLHVKKYVAILPKNFYILDDMFFCTSGGVTAGEIVGPTQIDGIRYPRSKVMRPADSITLNMCSANCSGRSSKSELSYTIKVPPGVARFSFNEGVVEIVYERMVTGEDGAVMIQDEPNTGEAIKFYMKTMMLQEKYIQGHVPRHIFKDIESKWEEYRDRAQISLKFPSPSETKYRALQQDARFRQFRYK